MLHNTTISTFHSALNKYLPCFLPFFHWPSYLKNLLSYSYAPEPIKENTWTVKIHCYSVKYGIVIVARCLTYHANKYGKQENLTEYWKMNKKKEKHLYNRNITTKHTVVRLNFNSNAWRSIAPDDVTPQNAASHLLLVISIGKFHRKMR